MTNPVGETLAQFIERRERELLAVVSALRGQLAPAEAELAQIRDAKRGLGTIVELPSIENALTGTVPQRTSNALMEGISPLGVQSPLAATMLLSHEDALARDNALSRFAMEQYPALARYSRMTIKELVIQALLDGFPNGGTTADIRKFIVVGYGRPIDANSMRAQMHRLKADVVLVQSSDIWNLEPRKRQLYAMYDHPTSRSAMKELQDEPVSNARRTIIGSAGED